MENQSTALNHCLASVWRRTQKKHLIAGVLALCMAAIPIFLLGILVDRYAYLPSSGRWVILFLLVGISLFQAWRHGFKNCRRFDPVHSAKQIETHHAELDSLLVTAVQFRDSGATPGTSSSLWQATLRKAEESVKSLRVTEIVSFAVLKRPLGFAAMMILLIGILAVSHGSFLAAGLARIFSPWSMVSYPTKTRIQLGELTMILKEGDAAKIEARLSGDVPETAEFELITGEGRPKDIDIEVVNGIATYQISSASRDFRYRIKAGDARSDWHNVRVIPAPRIDDVKVLLEFPAYLQKPAETVESLTLTVPEGTRVKWQFTLDQPIRSAVLNRDGQKPLQLEISGSGRQLVIDELVQASRGYSFSWVENKHGFEFTSPRYHLQVASDQVPRVEIVSPESNVLALLGRPLDLVVRAQDDHGIAAATITYRVNLRPEKTIPLTSPLRNGEGEQKLDWDYRKELTDLAIGDSISFVVEVRDRFPGSQGPHVARSDTRRITFLSKEDYLAQVEKKLDRLLSRVRAIYRQERSAHAFVENLDVKLESFSQTCQLEAIRQEMLREQIKGTSAEVRSLLADLALNNITDAVENDSLKKICAGLDSIADVQIAQAANLLRDQAGIDRKKTNINPDLTAANAMVNQAAMELANIVLQSGIDAAREVFALEVNMLAQAQAKLRGRSAESSLAADAQELAKVSKYQQDLAVWTGDLLKRLDQGMRYDKRPMSVLGLMRRMKEIRKSGAETTMKATSSLLEKREFVQATDQQLQIMKPLLKAEYSVRTGAEYSATTANRDLLISLLDQFVKLREECDSLTEDQYVAKRAELETRLKLIRKPLLQALISTIPAARTRLFDQAMPMPPPVDALRAATEKGINEALAMLEGGRKSDVVAKLQATEKPFQELTTILNAWSSELAMQTKGLTVMVSNSITRIARIEDCENRQIGIFEATLDEKPTKPLAESQRNLVNDMNAFKNELLEQDRANPSKDTQPLLNRMERVIATMTSAAASLDSGNADEAAVAQEDASNALIAAKELILAQNARLTLLQDIFSFHRSVSRSFEATQDIVDQQNDLIAATEDADEDSAKDILPLMKNMLQCLTDVAPLLDAVAARLDAGSALLFAGSDMEDAIAAIEDGDFEDAVDAQQVAADSLGKVQVLIQSVREQTNYLAEMIQYLHESMTDLAVLESDQTQIRLALEAKPESMTADVVTRLENLQKSAVAQGQTLKSIMGSLENYKVLRIKQETARLQQLQKTTEPIVVTEAPGTAEFTKAAELMAEALRLGKSGDAAAAVEQMKLAEAVLKENEEQIFTVITMLHGLSIVEVLSTSPPELPILLDALALASDQRQIFLLARFGKDDAMAECKKRQIKLDPKYLKLIQVEVPHPLLVKAQQHTQTVMQSTTRDEAIRYLTIADEALRQFIIEQALVLDTSLKPPMVSEPVPSESETDDLTVSDLVGSVSDFVSGEAPKDKRTEWEVLGTRNRAALNQNFARELPLEFRAMLKDYYEKVAK